MTIRTQISQAATTPRAPLSPLASERVRALALRLIEGAPALTFGEMRELADALLEHNARSDGHA